MIVALAMVLGLALSACGGNGGATGTTSGGSMGGPTPEVSESGDVCALFVEQCQDATAMMAAPQGTVPNSSTEYNYTVQQYLDYIVADLDTTWTNWFVQNGFEEPYVGYEVINPGETYTTTCTGGQQTVDDTYANAFYCPSDSIIDANGVEYKGVVVLPETTFQKMWEGKVFTESQNSATVGDFAAAIILAHEFGHHIKDELQQQLQAKNGTVVREPVGANNELLADCFAGVWMNSAYYTNLLTDTDYEEATSALYAIGDDGTGPDPHGTPEQRVAAITAGYNSGNPVSCVESYWS